jgi:hypothetical protein
MSLFSKETCVYCGKPTGRLEKWKLIDGEYLCSKCSLKCSYFFQK